MERLEAVHSKEIRKIASALSGELRLDILTLLSGGERSINEIAVELGIPLSTTTVNTQKLEQAGLITVSHLPGRRGQKKICALAYNDILLKLGDKPPQSSNIVEVDMPVGHFVHAQATPPCGICTRDGVIGEMDDPRVFFYPQKSGAQLIWISGGWLEYRFPSPLDRGEEARALEFHAEICSEVPGYNERAASDITLWVNGRETGTWKSPGDFGKKRGELTPRWWPKGHTQHGLPVRWRIDTLGSRCNGKKVDGPKISELAIAAEPSIIIRIGIKEDAANRRGMNIFGRHFGNHPNNILMRLEKKKPSSGSGS